MISSSGRIRDYFTKTRDDFVQLDDRWNYMYCCGTCSLLMNVAACALLQYAACSIAARTKPLRWFEQNHHRRRERVILFIPELGVQLWERLRVGGLDLLLAYAFCSAFLRARDSGIRKLKACCSSKLRFISMGGALQIVIVALEFQGFARVSGNWRI